MVKIKFKNPFRKLQAFENPPPGVHNPCDWCWRFKCDNCLCVQLNDFALTLRSSPELVKAFEKQHDALHYPGDRKTRRAAEKELNRRKKQRQGNKKKQKHLRVVDKTTQTD